MKRTFWIILALVASMVIASQTHADPPKTVRCTTTQAYQTLGVNATNPDC